MGLFALLDRHARLVDRMTEVLNIDLVEAAQRGEMAEEAVRGVVYTCAGCTRTVACADWMESHADGADETPDYCRNKQVLNGLAATRLRNG